MSQGGPPCIHHATSHNSIKNKHPWTLLPPSYLEGCENFKIHGETYSTSHLFNETIGAPHDISELELIKDNLPTSDYAWVKQWGEARYDFKKHMGKHTGYTMYQKRYLEWYENCEYIGKNGKKDQITAKELVVAVEHADALIFWIEFLWGLMQANIVIQLIEFVVIFTHK